LALVLCGLSALTPLPAEAAAPAGFFTEVVAGGFNLPTAIAFAPDGRIFVAEKGGVIKIIKDGVVLPVPFVTLPDVNDWADHGLLGLALDPNFAANGFVYLSYTHENTPGKNYEGPKTGRIVRLKASGDTADMSTYMVLVGTVGGDEAKPSCDDYPITADCLPTDSPSHSVGGLRFGPDGKLYATIGDGAGYFAVDPRALNSLNLDSLAGKILRLNTDGTAPADNPFHTGDPNANRSRIWAYGVRNSLRFNFSPLSNSLFAGDVGWYSWEEINIVKPGMNLGWPCREGYEATPEYNCATENYTDPAFAFHHAANNDPYAITGGTFSGTAYPEEYQHNYFLGHFGDPFIKRAVVSADDKIHFIENWFDNADGPVDFVTGPDGSIYYVAIFTGEVRHIVYAADQKPKAVATASVVTGVPPLSVAFSSGGSLDPEGSPLTFLWEFGDGATSTEANPAHVYAEGVYSAKLTVADGSGNTSSATLTIAAQNLPPENAFRAEYFNGMTLSGSPAAVETVPEVNFNWTVFSPDGVITPDHFSGRYTGRFTLGGTYRFTVTGDDGVRLFVDDNLLIDKWFDQGATAYTAEAKLTPGLHTVKLEYYENTGDAMVKLSWEKLAEAGVPAPSLLGANIVPTTTVIGNVSTLNAHIGNTGSPEPILVDMEIYNEGGTQIAQEFFENVVIDPGTEQAFALKWFPQVPGIYRLSVGLFSPAWGSLYTWVDKALEFTAYNREPVGDNAKPVITLTGEAAMSVALHSVFTDPGATALDKEDGDISGKIVVGGDTVNTEVSGTYLLTYNVTDIMGGQADQVTRTVQVLDSEPAGEPLAQLVSATTTPNPVMLGGESAIATEVLNTGAAGPVTVDIEVYDGPIQVAQEYFDDVAFEAGEKKPFSFIWKPTYAGTFDVMVGLFSKGWSTLYQWVSNAAQITAVTADPGPEPTPTSTAAMVIYDDVLAPGWENWSWEINASATTTPVYQGTQALAVEFLSPWAGYFLHHPGLDTTGRTTLTMTLYGTVPAGQQLQIVPFDATGAGPNHYKLAPYLPDGVLKAGQWQTVSIPLADIGAAGGTITGFAIQGNTGANEGTFYLDEVRIE